MTLRLIGAFSILTLLLIIALPALAQTPVFDLQNAVCDLDGTQGPKFFAGLSFSGNSSSSSFTLQVQVSDGSNSFLGNVNLNSLGMLSFGVSPALLNGQGLNFSRGQRLTVTEMNDDGQSVSDVCSSSANTGAATAITCSDLTGDQNRVNHDDCGAPVAVYLGSIHIYSVNPVNGDGLLSLRITDEQIAAVGVPVENTLLDESANPFTGQPIQIWRLTTGEFQLNTFYADGKAYTMTWEADGSGMRYLEH